MTENPDQLVTENQDIPDNLKVPEGLVLLLRTYGRGAGNGLFSRVTYIQRLYTDGGKPPPKGCDQANNQTEVLVEYSAQYFFYGSAAEQRY